MRKILAYLGGSKGLAHLLFLILGTGLLIHYVPMVLATPKEKPLQPLYTLVISIASSFLVVALVELTTKVIELWSDYANRGTFIEFFGEREGGFETVLIQAELPSDSHCNIKLCAPPDDAGSTLPEGIKHIIPFEDISAVIELDREFNRFGARLRMVYDTYKTAELPPGGCLSVGLGYNNVTVKLMKEHPELFQITYHDGTDDFKLGDTMHDRVEDGNDFALIARIVLGTEKDPAIYIICAGRSATGTVVACKYLAKQWKYLLSMYKHDQEARMTNKHSLAVMIHFNERTMDDLKQVRVVGRNFA